MSEAALTTTIEPAAAAPRNRLSIAHLLLWMAGTALVVALFPTGWLAAPDFVGDREVFNARVEQRRTLERLSVVAVAPCYGAAVASLLVAGVRLLWRRPGFPSLPGHWPLVNLGLWILIVAFVIGRSPDSPSVTYNLQVLHDESGAALIVLLILLLAVAIQGVRVVREPRRWRVALRCLLATVLLPVLAFALGPLDSRGTESLTVIVIVLAWYVAALVAVLAGLRDFVSRERFDLFHWTGVVCLLGILAHPPLTWLVADMWL